MIRDPPIYMGSPLRGREAGCAPHPEQNSLDGVWGLAEVQGPVAILGDSLRVGSGAEQEAHTVGAGGRTSLVQGCLAPRGKVDGGAAEQQEPQAVGVAPAGCDVQRCGELLLIAQRPQSCRGTGVRATSSPSAQNLPVSLKYLMYIPLRDLCCPSRD